MAPTTSATVGKAITFIPNGTTVEEGGYFTIYVSEGRTGRIVSGLIDCPGHDLREHDRVGEFLDCTNASMAWGALLLLTFFLACLIVVRLDVVVPIRIDRTVITSNHNFLDGLETYDTVTFDEHVWGSVHRLGHDLREHSRVAKTQVMVMRNNANLSIFYQAMKVVTTQGCTLYNGSTGFSIHNITDAEASCGELLSEDLPRAAMEGVLEDGVHAVTRREDGGGNSVDDVER
ncbi:hypothetical protein ZIOFF_026525 [Zingiber officinale]|uniref:Uncharacterized protein n=1 Tax=Zingiber officinale TaxID=94328 RepID=A0A8J5LI11_ZINOF|nr:hypothetical protein ZIOFF_026525 [Zingiber officinale]